MSLSVTSIFLEGESVDTILFQCAVYWAEFGENVWFISPKPINTLPQEWKKPPEKEILKLIFFIYIRETKDLISKLSEMHMLPRIPKIIVITEIEHYFQLGNQNFDATHAAFVSSNLIDAASIYSRKYSTPSFLITASNSINVNMKVRTILDLYFSKYFFHVNEECDVYKKIELLFKNTQH